MRYITHPGSANRQLFDSGFRRVRATAGPVVLSREYLARFGRFRIPAQLWQALGQYACWLDPVIVREWRQLTAEWGSAANRNSATRWEGTTVHDVVADHDVVAAPGMAWPKVDRQQTMHSSGPKAATTPAWRLSGRSSCAMVDLR